MLAPRQVAGLSIRGGNECPDARNVLTVQKVQTTVGTSAGLPSLDIAFYKGATPHKMGGISTECAVLTGGTCYA